MPCVATVTGDGRPVSDARSQLDSVGGCRSRNAFTSGRSFRAKSRRLRAAPPTDDGARMSVSLCLCTCTPSSRRAFVMAAKSAASSPCKHFKCDCVRHVPRCYLDLTGIKIVSSHGTSAAGAGLLNTVSLLFFNFVTKPGEASDNLAQTGAVLARSETLVINVERLNGRAIRCRVLSVRKCFQPVSSTGLWRPFL